ncbi:50S ribosomal protein L7/L12 [Quillaja saponaria]|uniref:50S ribosomal protein L7/L12 n=1 Tax=Quillaja saponaria TaxID=32244 RepID=A0AAD7L8F4_QUISA|nr:50S ribosomal protein L7/L12 [Quillaja saponaria]
MRYLRFISSHLLRIQKPLPQNLSFNASSIQNPKFSPTYNSKIPSSSPSISPCSRNYTTQAQESKPVQSEEVSAIVDELMGLTLLEVMDLVEILREKRGVNELPIMMMMMPGMGVGSLKGGPKGAPKGEEKKAEKTAFDVKLEEFDAASKIKVIKEVRTFTSLGLKEAKDLVEKVPTLLKKGVTKEEAETIIAKMKEVGAKVSME